MAGHAAAPRVLLGVAGGIAAYKACELLRRLTETGHAVRVLPTASALRFVGAATFEALSGQPVHTGVFADVPAVPHVKLGQEADLVVVAPATADLLARAAHGRADDLLTAALLTARCPVLFVPAMHTEMWEHPATRDNVALLRDRGSVVMEPASGRLTGRDTGPGRLPEPAEIAELARLLLERPDALPRDLAGRRVVVSAGGTREALDPVRFLGNRSSGRQGYALARVAAQRGASVTLVAAHTAELGDPAAVQVVRAGSARELREAMLAAAKGADAVVMTAAVADFRPAALADPQDQEGVGGPGAAGADPQPGHPRRAHRHWGARPGDRRLRRRDRRRGRRRPAPRAGQARPQGRGPAAGQRGGRRPGVRGAGQRGLAARRGRERDRAGDRLEEPAGLAGLGRGRGAAGRRLTPRRCRARPRH